MGRPVSFEDGVEVRAGAGSALVVDAYWEGMALHDFLSKVALLLDADVDDLAYLGDLDNGGERGAGLAVLRKALRVARARGYTLVVQARSESGDDADQGKLRTWYERTGLLKHVPGASAGRFLSNVFYDATRVGGVRSCKSGKPRSSR